MSLPLCQVNELTSSWLGASSDPALVLCGDSQGIGRGQEANKHSRRAAESTAITDRAGSERSGLERGGSFGEDSLVSSVRSG